MPEEIIEVTKEALMETFDEAKKCMDSFYPRFTQAETEVGYIQLKFNRIAKVSIVINADSDDW